MLGIDEKLTRLIGYSRVAFDTAQASQAWASKLQWFLAAIVAIAVFLPGETWAMIMAGLSFMGALVITGLGLRQRKFRRYGERVRRATLLAKGLGHELSAHEYRRIETGFEGDAESLAEKADGKYYASAVPPGEGRLIENLYESAFWSEDLYRHSSKRAWIRFGAMMVAVIIIVIMTMPFLDGDMEIVLSRVVLVIMTLLVSREIFGDAMDYAAAQHEVELILERLETLKDKADKTADLMLILGDYNASVQSAPMPQSGVYEARRASITKAWDAHKAS
ncbi:hypothetical protein [Henriciella sp.]|uniref:hypothetical protein n=1 Tax=Henriciella sp. TaxID=1968823 RepID=UPI002627C521|nr:hypothetical protein [Henriciella sp.]